MKKKIIIIALSIFCGLLLLLGIGYGYYKLCMDPYRGTISEWSDSASLDDVLTEEQAKEDLEYLMSCLRERHPAWLEESNDLAGLVESQYEKVLSDIEGDISVLELYKATAGIAAKLHDGHSYVTWNGEGQYIDDFTHFRQYGKPVSIDGIAVDELISRYKEVASYEVDYYAERRFFGNVFIHEQGLRLCGIDTSDGVTMVYDNDGEQLTFSYDFVPIEDVNGYEQGSGENEWVYYHIDKENSIGIFSLTTCICDEEYRETLEAFFEEVFAQEIQNVVVDLRGNGGGNSTVANEFISYLDVDEYKSWDSAVRFGWYLLKNEDITYNNSKKKQAFGGDVYVLTDVWTYSAAMDFAMLIADNDLGTIIGEPSGNLPDSYGDCLFFQMPNSNLVISVSYKKWYRIDQSKSGEPIMPDYEVPSGEALDKVYELMR